MSDLEGAPLALAVAKAVGKKTSGRPRADRPAPELTDHWRPDQGGAAGAEVLERIRLKANVELTGCHGLQVPPCTCKLIDRDPFRDRAVIAYGGTDWIALCRAVVAWSEQR